MKNKSLITILVILLCWNVGFNCSSISAETNEEDNLGQQIADYAVQFVGNPYAWGGTSLTNGADCSGFAYAVFQHFDIELKRVSNDQFTNGEHINIDDRQPGDLIFYGYSTGYSDHTAIYIGDDKIVHARNSAYGIVISDYNYWNYIGCRRYW